VTIDPDDFEEWAAHPITGALLRACAVGQQQARDAWMAATLEAGKCDPLVLAEIRARISVLQEIRNVNVEMLETMNGQD
jgi:hypothetical protein